MAPWPASEAAVAAPVAMRPLRCCVAARRRETADTWTLELEPESGAEELAARFGPGQFAMLYAFGIGEAPISVSAIERGQLVHTVREVGAVTSAICAAEPGAVLGLRGPFGTSWPVAAATGADVVIVAGGVGLAPLRPALQHVLANREEYGRLVVLYGGRRPDELLFRDELEAWAARDDLELGVTVDAADAGWTGRVGVVTKLVERAGFDPEAAVAMVCGPEVMMRFAVAALGDRGLSADRVHVSLERNMKCAVGLCGHCQLGTVLICRDGAVFPYPTVERLMRVREL
jgi:NAD(P)H-flavin reductase